MTNNLNKFLIVNNYVSRIKILQKKIKIKRLEKLICTPYNFDFIWNIESNNVLVSAFTPKNEYSIFGIKINLDEQINWHQDKFSDFVYPLKRFDKINAAQWFNTGIDLVFPWEQSRFYFAVLLAQKYVSSKNKNYFDQFKSLILDWIDKNPFLYGVNWLSTMDVAIRSVNWLVAINLFAELYEKEDSSIKEKLTISLSQHAEYIYSFPLIEKNGLTTNHTTSAYAGLLFLALSLKDHPKSKLWLNEAVNGLEMCMKDQIYEDGVDFEGSIPYHRLVLELFAYSAICARANGVNFTKMFYEKLFKMFEFSAAYLDKNGNAPQIGDNDSGRLLIFNTLKNDPYENEHDHSYLLNLGEHIFEYNFKSKCKKRDNVIQNFLPKINKLNLYEINVIPRETDKSISFVNGGAYFLKNKFFDLCVSCFPTGQKGKGGHNHLDIGSFTLSIDGEPFIVDPGSYCYSRDKKKRDIFRTYTYHNTIYNSNDENLDLSENGYWSLKKYYDYQILNYGEKLLDLKIKFVNDDKYRYQKFELFEDELLITNKYDGKFFSRVNLHPSFNKFHVKKNNIIINNNYKISINSNAGKKTINNYEYSPHYGKKELSWYILIETSDVLSLKLEKER